MSESTICEKIAKAAEEIGVLSKDGHNDFHDYDYVTEAAVKAAVGPALRRNGLYILDVSHTPVTNVAGVDFTKVLVMTTLTVSDGNAHVTSTALGSGTDKGDKAAYKAMAGGLKYALTSLFLIATGDDAEADASTDRKPREMVTKEAKPASKEPKEKKAPKAEKKADSKEETSEATPTESTNASLKALEIIKGIATAAELKKATGELAELRAKMVDADFQIVKQEFAAKRAVVEGK